MFKKILFIISITFVFFQTSSYALEPEISAVDKFKEMEFGLEDEVRFYGGNLDFQRDKNLIIGRDAVDIEYRGMDLQADYVEYNLETADVKARGNVVVEDGTSVLFCEELELNLRTRTGIIRNGELFLEPTYYLTGVELRRLGFDRYKIVNGYYTACQAETPAWTVKSKEADAQVNGFLTAKGSSLEIKKVPVFYSPYLLFPIKKDRSTGFLVPRIGYSQRKGLRWKQPFFWAMSDYSDLTLTPDIQGKRGIGIEANFNYLIDEKSSGTANVYYITTKSTSRNREGGDAKRKQRWNIYFYEKRELGDGLHLATKLDVSSDHNFDRDYGEVSQKITKASDLKLDSFMSLSKSWDEYYYKLNIGRMQDRIKSFPRKERDKFADIINDKTYQYLPKIQFVALEQPVFGQNGIIKGLEKLNKYIPLKFRLDSSFASIRSKWKSKEYAKKDGKTEVENFDEVRLDFHPEIILPLNIKELLSIRGKVGIRETFYSNRSDGNHLKLIKKNDGTLKKVNLSGNSDSTREIYNIEIDAEGPKAYALLNTKVGNLEKIKHIVQPSIKYVYIPQVNQKHILQADEEDFISGREYIKWNLENSIYGSFGLEESGNVAKEIMRLSMSQYYDLRKDNGKYRRLIEKRRYKQRINNIRAMSDLRLALEVYPITGLTLGFTGYMDPVDGALDRFISHFRYATELFNSKISFSFLSHWTTPKANQALDWDEPDFNPIFIKDKPYENIFSTVRLNIDFPGGWETGYTANFFGKSNTKSDESLNSSFFEQKQKDFNLRLKYSAQCWSVEGNYGVREYFREKGSLRSFDDETKDDEYFWVVVELKTLGEISTGGM
ncbi:MAG: LPS-assembly protein LptD [Candidatus Schekmanbacteria bacterium]|nr:MAG: LPS-assembly protein LptD [Candidatus Schekmanbacteria bacterium]